MSTNGDFSNLLVAAGCYVVGNNSPLAVMTSSDFNPGQGPSLPIFPHAVRSIEARKSICGLP